MRAEELIVISRIGHQKKEEQRQRSEIDKARREQHKLEKQHEANLVWVKRTWDKITVKLLATAEKGEYQFSTDVDDTEPRAQMLLEHIRSMGYRVECSPCQDIDGFEYSQLLIRWDIDSLGETE